jgi:hypothetical protein
MGFIYSETEYVSDTYLTEVHGFRRWGGLHLIWVRAAPRSWLDEAVGMRACWTAERFPFLPPVLVGGFVAGPGSLNPARMSQIQHTMSRKWPGREWDDSPSSGLSQGSCTESAGCTVTTRRYSHTAARASRRALGNLIDRLRHVAELAERFSSVFQSGTWGPASGRTATVAYAVRDR